MGMFADAKYTPMNCDNRMMWTEYRSKYDMSHHFCEFRLIYKDNEVLCESNFTTGLVPECSNENIRCRVTKESV